MNKIKGILGLGICILLLVGVFGCATAPIQLNTSTGKPEVVVNSTKDAVADYITSVMLSWDYMIKNQAGNMLVFYKNTTYYGSEKLFDTAARPGEFRITFNLVNISNAVRVMVSITGVRNPNTAYEKQEEDRSKGTQDSVNVQKMLNDMKSNLEGAAINTASNQNPGKVGIRLSDSDGKTILATEENGPAAKAGLQAGDIIMSIDGNPAAGNAAENVSRISGAVGSACTLLVSRNGTSKVVSVVRQKRPDSGWASSPSTTETKPASEKPKSERIVVEGLGVIIDGNTIASLIADGPAVQAGVMKGDVITMIDGEPVAENFLDSASKLAGKTNTSVVLTLKRGEKELTIPVIRKNP
jgi:membrane-associated protease RseP (regulator of RpoE activity)